VVVMNAELTKLATFAIRLARDQYRVVIACRLVRETDNLSDAVRIGLHSRSFGYKVSARYCFRLNDSVFRDPSITICSPNNMVHILGLQPDRLIFYRGPDITNEKEKRFRYECLSRLSIGGQFIDWRADSVWKYPGEE